MTLANKNTQTAIVIQLHTFTKVKKKISILKTDVKDLKNQNGTFKLEKYNI